jgi:hypothetical protein
MEKQRGKKKKKKFEIMNASELIYFFFFFFWGGERSSETGSIQPPPRARRTGRSDSSERSARVCFFLIHDIAKGGTSTQLESTAKKFCLPSSDFSPTSASRKPVIVSSSPITPTSAPSVPRPKVLPRSSISAALGHRVCDG